ncbi:MAG: hypothetical protein LBJ21_05260 [Acidobacteriota bacterium]|jgi:hypothetical protein|nr:hypothetical protein [Acidobacteriota bacterium]
MDILWNPSAKTTPEAQRIAAFAAEAERSREFAKILEKVDADRQSTMKTDREKADETRELQEKKDKEKKINELRGLIAQLRQKLAGSGYDRAIAARLSAAETELFWLLFQI